MTITEQPATTTAVSIPNKTLERIGELVAEASLIPATITNEVQAGTATEIHASMAETRRAIDKTRKTLKEPYLAMCKRIEEAAQTATNELIEEEKRLSRALGDYYALQEAKKRAQAKLDQAENEADRMRAGLLAGADTLEEHDDLRDKFSEENAAKQSEVATIQEGPKAPSVRKDWDVTVTDIWLLAKAHPTCVKIEPKLGEIKELLRNGVKVAGINAVEVHKIK